LIFGWPNIGNVSVGSASAQRPGTAKAIWKNKKSAAMVKRRHKALPADLVLSVINTSTFEQSQLILFLPRRWVS
jgi:hypothetical protein